MFNNLFWNGFKTEIKKNVCVGESFDVLIKIDAGLVGCLSRHIDPFHGFFLDPPLDQGVLSKGLLTD